MKINNALALNNPRPIKGNMPLSGNFLYAKNPKGIENTLYALENYNRGGLNLAFLGESVSSIKEDCKQMLLDYGIKVKDDNLLKAIFYAGEDLDVAKTQKEILNTILEIPKIDKFGIFDIMRAVSNEPEIAQEQKKILSRIVQTKKFTPGEVTSIFVDTLRKEKKEIELLGDFIEELSQGRNLKGNQITDIVSNLLVGSSNLKAKTDLALMLLDSGKLTPEEVSFCIFNTSNKSEVMEIQSNLAKELLSSPCVSQIVSSFKNDSPDMANLRKNLISELFESGKLSDTDIAKIVSSLGSNDKNMRKQCSVISDLLKNGVLEKTCQKQDGISRISSIMNYIIYRPDVDIKNLLNFMDKIDFEKLSDIAPLAKTFDFEERLAFCDYHFRGDKKTEFEPNDLVFPQDLTEFLSNNYLDNRSLTDLFSIYPMTKREVGKVPEGWLDKVPENLHKEAINSIYKAISDFQENRRVRDFQIKMKKILNKRVRVGWLGSGAYGTCFKISAKGAPDTCLKIFFEDSAQSIYNGEHNEVQMGLFANKHSDKFVKMYFGRVSPKSIHDGFLVTQFLDENIKPEKSKYNFGKFLLNSEDASGGHNIINGQIIDYGGTKIIDFNTYKPVLPYDFLRND